jgi:hypothetical protein
MVSYLKALIHGFTPLVSQLGLGIVVVASCTATPVLADAPLAVTIVTHLTFYRTPRMEPLKPPVPSAPQGPCP